MKKVVRNYTRRAIRDLAALDRHIAKRILAKVEVYSEGQDPLTNTKQLTGNFSGLFRYRIGDYRVVFEIDSKGTIIILTILTIRHRKDVYDSDL